MSWATTLIGVGAALAAIIGSIVLLIDFVELSRDGRRCAPTSASSTILGLTLLKSPSVILIAAALRLPVRHAWPPSSA